MKYSQLFTKTRKESPSDEQSKNADLLIRAGYIHKEMAGVYAYLPLGIKVVEKIKQVVREEMNAIGGQELIMTNLQRKELWQETDRWDDQKVDIWFKTKLQDGKELGLAWSHEEPITDMMKNYINSYRDLPVYVYQFQTKLRNELRAKSGIMRGREFVMKDLYSYSLTQADHQKFYDQTKDAYMKVYDRLGLGEITYITYASGGAFTKEYSHEFQTVTEAGEDVIYIDDDKNVAVNEEMIGEGVLEELGLEESKLRKVKASEVGNIFSFGTGKTDQLGLYFTDEKGEKSSIYLGSYGIGVTRLMGVIAEHFADDKGLIWPESIAPFKYHLVAQPDQEVLEAAEKLYQKLISEGNDVLFDDRDERFGVKMSDAELLGIPNIIVLGKKSLSDNNYELIDRKSGEKTFKAL